MKKCIAFLLLIFSINLQAQDQPNSSSFLYKTDFKIGYFGNFLFDNGLNLGAEYVWKEEKKVKEKSKEQKIVTHKVLFNGSIGYSTNFTNQTDNGLTTFYGLIWRRTNLKGRQLSVEVNPLGYYRSFLPETFEVVGNKVAKVKFPGRSYYAPSIAIGIGKLLSKKCHPGRYLKLNFTLRTPYNAGVLPSFTFHLGHRFNFKRK